MFIIITGDPVDGHAFRGPYTTAEEAVAVAIAQCGPSWCVAPLADA